MNHPTPRRARWRPGRFAKNAGPKGVRCGMACSLEPKQTKNVADNPRYASTRAGLERRLMEELRRTGDPRLIDNGKFFETPPMAGPTKQ